MLKIRIELHSARTGKVTEIGCLVINNISLKGNQAARGDYRVRMLRRGSQKVIREGRVWDYPRRSYNVWRLVFRALKAVLPEEAVITKNYNRLDGKTQMDPEERAAYLLSLGTQVHSSPHGIVDVESITGLPGGTK